MAHAWVLLIIVLIIVLIQSLAKSQLWRPLICAVPCLAPVQGFPPVLELALPVVNRVQVGVQHDGETCYSGVEARQVPPEVWTAVDAALQQQGEANTNGSRTEGG